MLAEHFGNGDGSPPITAFTADDSYPEKESCRGEDRQEAPAQTANQRISNILSGH
jgi:hypothetical protein